jgi:glycosyltransferase involved in cell wall biosynthesis
MTDHDRSYPRVLILSRTEITEFNSQGAALGNWFHDWPKEKLAHLFSARRGAREPFCGYSYLLAGRERRWGRLFDRLKREGMKQRPNHDLSPHVKKVVTARTWLSEAVQRVGKAMLVDTGLGELLFSPRLSKRMDEWICRFQPDVVFAMVTDLSFMRYAQMLNEHYQIPLCIEINDDWPNVLYRKSAFSFAMFPLVDRTFRRLLAKSSICLTIGKEMEREYKDRYKVHTEASMCCDEPERFLAAAARRVTPRDEITIVYCGGLFNNRWKSMLDLLRAVEALRSSGKNIGVSIYSSEMPPEAKAAFPDFPWVRYSGTLPHEEVAGILKGADILFHGECFDSEYYDYIRYSVSSKVQLYMLSGAPILVYGPSGVGVVEYARNSGWAYVVDCQDTTLIEEAILRLASDASLRGQIVAQALETFHENHDAHTVRERLRQILCQTSARRLTQQLPNRNNDKVPWHI